MEEDENLLGYLRLLSSRYPCVQAAATEIVQLSAQLNLPKETEHFISDIHGEFESFSHVMKSGSGTIKLAIDDLFTAKLTPSERIDLATLIYYPGRKLPLLLQMQEDKKSWFRYTLQRLLAIFRFFSSHYTSANVRQILPPEFSPIIEELFYGANGEQGEDVYQQSIIDAIITTDSAKALIVTLAELIQKLAVARLHIIGDIYDRGPKAHKILDALMDYRTVDIQWGNHDIVWMGAAAGSEACMANVVRVALRYGDLETIENGYGISLLPLLSYALETYGDDPCERFQPRVSEGHDIGDREIEFFAKMHKAIAIIQFKLEGQVIQRRPQYQMDDRLLLDKIDFTQGSILIDKTSHPLLDTFFPTVDCANPYELTEGEQKLVDKLGVAFVNSVSLQKHVQFLFARGGMYRAHNGNLLYHGCIAMNTDGSFKSFQVAGESFSGKAFLDRVETLARQGFYSNDDLERKLYGLDVMWYLWNGAQSPLFGKEKMATFERYFVADGATHVEHRNAYYDLRNTEETARQILTEFNLNPDTGRIVNGHVPVKVIKGESPVKANGKLVVIDGGFSKAYQDKTGIAGYTLVSDANRLYLVAHQPFESVEEVVEGRGQTGSIPETLETRPQLLTVGDTDKGREIIGQIEQLQGLIAAYRGGLIKENMEVL